MLKLTGNNFVHKIPYKRVIKDKSTIFFDNCANVGFVASDATPFFLDTTTAIFISCDNKFYHQYMHQCIFPMLKTIYTNDYEYVYNNIHKLETVKIVYFSIDNVELNNKINPYDYDGAKVGNTHFKLTSNNHFEMLKSISNTLE